MAGRREPCVATAPDGSSAAAATIGCSGGSLVCDHLCGPIPVILWASQALGRPVVAEPSPTRLSHSPFSLQVSLVDSTRYSGSLPALRRPSAHTACRRCRRRRRRLPLSRPDPTRLGALPTSCRPHTPHQTRCQTQRASRCSCLSMTSVAAWPARFRRCCWAAR